MNECPSIGNPETFQGEAFVCYLDILGFSQRVLDHWSDGEKSPLEQLMRFKGNLPVVDTQTEAELNIDGGRRRYLCRISTYSDSITICHGLRKGFTYGDAICGIFAVVGNALQVWRNAITEGFTVRGAIELGSVFWNTSELIGPAFIKAYELESKWAKSSRILVGPAMSKRIRTTFMKAAELQQTITNYFLRDTDGYIILNPVNLRRGNTKADILAKLTQMSDHCSDYFQKQKYRDLLNHLQLDDDYTNWTFDQFGAY